MKINIRKSFSLVHLLLVCAIIGLFAALAIPVQAQVTPIPYARNYWLTNTTTFTMASGGTNLAGSATSLIQSQPFPLRPGRGFAFFAEFVGTNASTAAETFNFQFANVVTNGTALVTNWNTYGLAAVGYLMNGTTRVYAFTNVPPLACDNAQLGRLYSVANAHTAGCSLSPTNTYVSITGP